MIRKTIVALLGVALSAATAMAQSMPDGFAGFLKAVLARQHDEWLRDWSENMRTNTALETCASFRDTKLRPFLLHEMDIEGKATKDERKFLDDVVDTIWTAGMKGVGKYDRLNKILARTARRSFADLVREATGKKRCVKSETIVRWLEEGNFHGDDMRGVFWTFRRDISFTNRHLLENYIEKADIDEWLKLLWHIGVERADAWKARGGGWASNVTGEGWDGFAKHGKACREAFNRAMELHSFPEPLYLFSDLGPFDDDLFVRATAAQMDYHGLFSNYLWYNCYPRWCGSLEKMKVFAERCRETKRHDTMIPYFYAEALLKMVKDMGVAPEDYFRDHADELDKIIEVCTPQIKNRNAFASVRQSAAVCATFAYSLKGDLDKTVETWRSFDHRTLPNLMYKIFESAYLNDRWLLWNVISGKRSADFLRLHKLYLADDFSGFMSAAGEVKRKHAKLTADEESYIEERLMDVRMKLDFPSGKPVPAAFPKSKACWLTYGGAWRLDGSCAYLNKMYKGGDPLEWNVSVDGEFRMECEIAPHGECDSWQFEFHQKPGAPAIEMSGTYPHLWLDFKKDGCELFFAEWVDIHDSKSAKATSVPYSGGAVKLVVEYNHGKVSVFLGDDSSPVFETEYFADFLNTVKYGHLKFNGSHARINSLKVMKPKRAD